MRVSLTLIGLDYQQPGTQQPSLGTGLWREADGCLVCLYRCGRYHLAGVRNDFVGSENYSKLGWGKQKYAHLFWVNQVSVLPPFHPQKDWCVEKYNEHGKLTQKQLTHFGKVKDQYMILADAYDHWPWNIFIFCLFNYANSLYSAINPLHSFWRSKYFTP